MTATVLSPAASAALLACFATKGKNAGQLLAKAPKSDTLAYAAWQGAMMSCNPFKASIMGLMLMTDEQRSIQEEVTRFLDAAPKAVRVAMQRDRAVLTNLGAW